MVRQATQPATPATAASAADVSVARSPHLDASLDKAHRLAVSQRHEGVTSEHLLFALTEDVEALTVLTAANVAIERLRADIGTHLGQLPASAAAGKAILPNPDLLKVLKLAAMAAQQSARRQIDGAIVLAAVIGDASTPSAGLLRAHGLTFNEVIRVLQKGPASPAQPQTQPPAQPPGRTAPPAGVSPPPAPAGGGPVAAPPMAAAPTARQPAPPPPQPPIEEPPTERIVATAVAAEQPSRQRPIPAPAGNAAAGPRSLDDATDSLLVSVRERLQQSAPPPPLKGEKGLSAKEQGESLSMEPAPLEIRPSDAGIAQRSEPKSPPAPEMPLTQPPQPMETVSLDEVKPEPPAPVQHQQPTRVSPPQMVVPQTPDDLIAPRIPTQPVRQPILAPAPQPNPLARTGPPPLPIAPATAAMPPTGAVMVPQPPPHTQPLRPVLPPPPKIDLRGLMAAIPKRMRQGETRIIEVTIPRRALEIAMTPGHRWPPLRVATMRLRAADEAAHVELTSPETLWISPPRVHQGTSDDATWRWRLTPRASGLIRVSLSGATRIVGADGITGEVLIGEEATEIDVARTKSRRWLVGVLLFGNLIALGILAMVMSGRASALLRSTWKLVGG